MKKQTAVEWLVQALIMSEDNPNYNQWAIQQAKKMEKEQIIQASCCGGDGESGAEQYYNETFKSE